MFFWKTYRQFKMSADGYWPSMLQNYSKLGYRLHQLGCIIMQKLYIFVIV